MITKILSFLASIIISIISATGHSGVFLLMTLESCGVPAPSEVIMPFGGFLVATGRLNFWLVVLMGTLGNLVGSLIAYTIGLKGGRPLIERYGKYILISHHDLDKADGWFARYGDFAVFAGRLLPVVRTYISFPAGIAKMNVKKFSLYTTLGALPWCILFTWLGVKLQNHWELIHTKLHFLNYVVAGAIICAAAWYVWQHLKKRRAR